MTIGAEELIQEFGSPLGVAEAFILGKVKNYRQQHVSEVVSNVTLEAARIRLEALGLLTKESILPAK